MFVILKYDDSYKIDVFGPSTRKECEAWLKLKKIHPLKDHSLPVKILPQAYNIELTDY